MEHTHRRTECVQQVAVVLYSWFFFFAQDRVQAKQIKRHKNTGPTVSRRLHMHIYSRPVPPRPREMIGLFNRDLIQYRTVYIYSGTAVEAFGLPLPEHMHMHVNVTTCPESIFFGRLLSSNLLVGTSTPNRMDTLSRILQYIYIFGHAPEGGIVL